MLPLRLQVLLGNRVHYVHAMHAKYGPVVRITPDEVSVSSPQAVRQVHRVSPPFPKTAWYKRFTRVRPNSAFGMTDRYEHAARRRLIAQPLSETGLKTFEDQVKSRVQLAVRRIDDEIKREGHADVMKWFTFLATDVVGDLSFGEGFNVSRFTLSWKFQSSFCPFLIRTRSLGSLKSCLAGRGIRHDLEARKGSL